MPSDFLVSEVPDGVVHQLMLTDEHGDVIHDNIVTEEHLWTQLTAKVISPCSGNACWAFVNVEDKNPPIIQCDDIELPCYLANTYEPIVLDFCSDAEFELIGETTTRLTCEDPYIQTVHRTYTAVDGFGNRSAPVSYTHLTLPTILRV